MRGGSWINQSINCRSANRNNNEPDARNNNNGFRVVVGALTLDCQSRWKRVPPGEYPGSPERVPAKPSDRFQK
ncbi:MAG: SUMF1/EgtB/PvdO family nonheme iron enzyme [Blastocatellales bacterium]